MNVQNKIIGNHCFVIDIDGKALRNITKKMYAPRENSRHSTVRTLQFNILFLGLAFTSEWVGRLVNENKSINQLQFTSIIEHTIIYTCSEGNKPDLRPQR